jgi:hypothetical protein
VQWYIPPLLPGETVEHYCMRASVSALNDVNPYNNEVFSNVVYVGDDPLKPMSVGFETGNPTDEDIPLELSVHATLPDGWTARVQEPTAGVTLKPGEQRRFHVQIIAPPEADIEIEPPLDGDIRGEVYGCITGPVSGTLTRTIWDKQRLRGMFAASLAPIGSLVGAFDGRLNTLSGEIEGFASCVFQPAGPEGSQRVSIGVRGHLRPWRHVDIQQMVKGEPIDGITLQVQFPVPAGPFSRPLPSCTTRVVPEPEDALATGLASSAPASGEA